MKNLLISFIAVFGAIHLGAQCPTAPVLLTSQAEVDAFPASCVNLTGPLTISGADISNVNALANLETISGNFFILSNPSLTDLSGLSNLTAVGTTFGSLNIFDNDALLDLSGLNSLSSINSTLFVEGNAALTTLNGLGPISSLANLYIAFNSSLGDINALSSVTSIGGYIEIQGNGSLTSLAGLSGVSGAIGGYLYIGINNSLSSIDGFGSLTSVGGNFDVEDNASLTNLNAFGSLSTVGARMFIQDNPQLTSIDDLVSLTSVGTNMAISNNPSLTSIANLTNIFTIGGTLEISGNTSLSQCEAEAVCEHIDNGNPTVISGNAVGCQNITQVEIACGLLPVELTFFRGKMEQGDVVLNWQTASEKDNAWFEVEHSTQGTEGFNTIGKVAGNGTSTVANDYAFRHAHPAAGPHLYRLKQVDFDGKFEYSNIVSVVVRGEKEVVLAPNPTQGTLFVRGLKDGELHTAVVTDFAGREVLRHSLAQSALIDLSEQPDGIYFVEIRTPSQTTTQRVVKRGN
ncbi:MAG: T9SS type A sorting domain-containing protein [Saprospiraceae bacterium]|nr:T9SS type A sorting domain-containing protein [Saprospiraceae bacterium]